jgi:adenosylmethionine-8-amino-7-oxononanoate aminotransferase
VNLNAEFGIGFFTAILMMALSLTLSEFVTEKTSEVIYKQCEENGVYVYPDSRIIKCEVK